MDTTAPNTAPALHTAAEAAITAFIGVLDKIPLTDSGRMATPTATKARAAIGRLQAALAAAQQPAEPAQDQRDAARYRWLRSHAPAVLITRQTGWWKFAALAPSAPVPPLDDEERGELDRAIDAAMAPSGTAGTTGAAAPLAIATGEQP